MLSELALLGTMLLSTDGVPPEAFLTFDDLGPGVRYEIMVIPATGEFYARCFHTNRPYITWMEYAKHCLPWGDRVVMVAYQGTERLEGPDPAPEPMVADFSCLKAEIPTSFTVVNSCEEPCYPGAPFRLPEKYQPCEEEPQP